MTDPNQPAQPDPGPPSGQPYGHPAGQPDPQQYQQQYGQPGYSDAGSPQQGYGQPMGDYGGQYGGSPYGGQPLPPLAHWGLRFGGYLIDGLVLLPAYIVAVVIMALTTDASGEPSSLGFTIGGIFYLAAVVFAIWNIVFRQGRTGWSIGKQVVGIRLLKEQTMQPLGAGMTFVRQLAHFLDTIACYIGWLWPLWDAKKQTFADKIIGTVVVVQGKPKQ